LDRGKKAKRDSSVAESMGEDSKPPLFSFRSLSCEEKLRWAEERTLVGFSVSLPPFPPFPGNNAQQNSATSSTLGHHSAQRTHAHAEEEEEESLTNVRGASVSELVSSTKIITGMAGDRPSSAP